MTTTPALRVSNLHHEYPNGHYSLEEVAFTVGKGEFVVILGPTGSGKSTVLRLIAGFLTPASGKIEVTGRSVVCRDHQQDKWVPPTARGLGMMFGENALWPHLSVADNVAFPLRSRRIHRDQIQRRVLDVLAHVGLLDYAQSKPIALSDSQAQRTALARAIIAEPELLLLDEAFAALDEPLRASMRLELKALTKARNLSTLYVTNDRTEALALADKIVVMEHGKIHQIGTPEEISSTPATAFVANYVCDAPVLKGSYHAQGLYLDEPPLRLAPQQLQAMLPEDTTPDQRGKGRGGSRRVHVALLPDDVQLYPPSRAHHANPEALAQVTAKLFLPGGYEYQLLWCGKRIRKVLPDGARYLPDVGDMVDLHINRAHVYPLTGHIL